jgi:hypothetical protein
MVSSDSPLKKISCNALQATPKKPSPPFNGRGWVFFEKLGVIKQPYDDTQ